MTLKLVSNKKDRRYAKQYALPEAWETSIESWLRWLRISGLSPNSIQLRRGCVRVIARRSLTQHPAEVTLDILVDLCGNAIWSNDYRKVMRASLTSYFEWAIGQKLVSHNVADALPRVSESKPNPRPAPDSVWFDLLEKAPPRARLAVLLAGEGGLRRAEVACVHRHDLMEDVHGYSLIVHGKGGKQRVVPITDSLAKAIHDHILREGIDGYLFPGDPRRNSPLGHITPHYLGQMISDLMPPGWTMHKLRHRFATRGHNGTGNLRAVQEALGHTSVATTQKYVAVSLQDIRAVSNAAFKETPKEDV